MRNKQTYSRFIQNVLSWSEFPKGRMIQFLHHCVEHGITAFDNADFTGRNYIGKLFGVALSESGLSRDEIQLISKYGAPENEGDKLIETVDNLLLDLETDYLDLLLLDYPHLTPIISDAVERLMSQGKVIEVGGLNLEDPHVRDFDMPLLVEIPIAPETEVQITVEVPEALGRTVVTIGNFDGVHLGHQHVVARERLADLHDDLGHAARGRRLDVGVDLVGRDRGDDLVGLHPVAGLLAPLDDGALRDGDAHLRHRDVHEGRRISTRGADGRPP